MNPGLLRWRWLLVALCLLAATRPAWAQGALRVTAAPAPVYTFGEVATFQISARGPADIQQVRLFYRDPSLDRTVVNEADFTPGPSLTATVTLDLQARPLPAYARVTYWWELRDAAGASLETDPQEFFYEDNRFAWQQRSQAGISVHWYEGDLAFGQTALDVALGSARQLNQGLSATLPDPLRVYIYAHPQDAAEVLRATGRVWAAAHADPAQGVVVAAVPPGVEARVQLERQLPHELAHVAVFAAAGGADGYARVPTWLNEGLAVVSELRPDPDAPALLAAAHTAGQLLPLASLCGPFPADSRQAQLAYLQSAAVVRYLRDTYGAPALLRLLQAYAGGAACDAGLGQALGLSLESLQADWQAAAGLAQPEPMADWQPWLPWLIIGGLVLAAPVLFVLLTRRRVV